MRFLVALILGLAVMFGLNAIFDFFSMSRPLGSILMGVTVGVTMLIVLLIWEAVRPTPPKGESAKAKAKAQKSEEERAQARAERRARLAAEAGVSLEGIDGALPGSSAKPGDTAGSGEDGAAALGEDGTAASDNEDRTAASADEAATRSQDGSDETTATGVRPGDGDGDAASSGR
jgi:pyruvate/2-oxoglutarate dehydrogenase complex dihydrolipoamide acyltransferase (E2) component